MPSKQFVFFLIYITISVSNVEGMNPLNGQHLRIILMEYPVALSTIRNGTGHVIEYDGSLKQHLLALSNNFNFSFSLLPIIAPLFEDTQTTIGGLHYLINDEADFILGTVLATPYRLKYADFPTSWMEGKSSCIIPYPRETLNVAASLKPYSYEVWILIVAAGFVAVIYLRISIKKESKVNQRNRQNWKGDIWKITQFVLRNLVSQGQVYYSSRLAFRIAAGAWCCSCFFLVQIYSSTLTSHLTSPNQKPIASSVEELVDTPGLSFTVQRNYGLDITLQNAKFGTLKKIADSINKDPSLRCNLTTGCLEIVQKGYAGFGAAIHNLKSIMHEDVKTTGTCNYYMMKDTYLRLSLFTPLRKNSPYTGTISIGILRLQQSGLSEFWESWYVAKPWKCMEINRRAKVPRLTIGHLSSAFVILLIGYVFGFVAFCFENIKF